jgi:YidC/Oxa1 family membrane protein insertase
MSKFRFLGERRALKEFESLPPERRDIVFYSEGAGDWPHVGPVVELLLTAHGRNVTYLSSDESDPGLSLEHPNFWSCMVGSGTARTVLFARLECRHFVMTLPDLDSFWLKRSVHPVHYVYLFHSMNSTHASYRNGAFDAYDTILCVGPYQVEEIRRTERARGLRAKELVEHGSVKLDSVLAEVAGRVASDHTADTPRVLVAPSWGDCSLIEQPVGIEVIDVLVAAGYPTTLRLHPMTVRRLPKLVDDIVRRYGGRAGFTLEQDMNAVDSWLRSSVMISDWSGAAIEFAFALQRPVIYIDTPQKTVNPEWRQLDVVPFEALVREEIGRIVNSRDVHTLPAVIGASLAEPEAMRERALAARAKHVFNVGRSATAAADYLASLETRVVEANAS